MNERELYQVLIQTVYKEEAGGLSYDALMRVNTESFVFSDKDKAMACYHKELAQSLQMNLFPGVEIEVSISTVDESEE